MQVMQEWLQAESVKGKQLETTQTNLQKQLQDNPHLALARTIKELHLDVHTIAFKTILGKLQSHNKGKAEVALKRLEKAWAHYLDFMGRSCHVFFERLRVRNNTSYENAFGDVIRLPDLFNNVAWNECVKQEVELMMDSEFDFLLRLRRLLCDDKEKEEEEEKALGVLLQDDTQKAKSCDLDSFLQSVETFHSKWAQCKRHNAELEQKQTKLQTLRRRVQWVVKELIKAKTTLEQDKLTPADQQVAQQGFRENIKKRMHDLEQRLTDLSKVPLVVNAIHEDMEQCAQQFAETQIHFVSSKFDSEMNVFMKKTLEMEMYTKEVEWMKHMEKNMDKIRTHVLSMVNALIASAQPRPQSTEEALKVELVEAIRQVEKQMKEDVSICIERAKSAAPSAELREQWRSSRDQVMDVILQHDLLSCYHYSMTAVCTIIDDMGDNMKLCHVLEEIREQNKVFSGTMVDAETEQMKQAIKRFDKELQEMHKKLVSDFKPVGTLLFRMLDEYIQHLTVSVMQDIMVRCEDCLRDAIQEVPVKPEYTSANQGSLLVDVTGLREKLQEKANKVLEKAKTSDAVLRRRYETLLEPLVNREKTLVPFSDCFVSWLVVLELSEDPQQYK